MKPLLLLATLILGGEAWPAPAQSTEGVAGRLVGTWRLVSPASAWLMGPSGRIRRPDPGVPVTSCTARQDACAQCSRILIARDGFHGRLPRPRPGKSGRSSRQPATTSIPVRAQWWTAQPFGFPTFATRSWTRPRWSSCRAREMSSSTGRWGKATRAAIRNSRPPSRNSSLR